MSNQQALRKGDPHRIVLQSVWNPPSLEAPVWCRRFGRPGSVGPQESVFLVIGNQHIASLSLNNNSLPKPKPNVLYWRHNITNLLRHRNELVIVPAAPLRDYFPDKEILKRVSLPKNIGSVFLEILTKDSTER
ncbi:MAG: hypothetical protein ABGW78_09750 [Pirellulales bacterium]